MGDCQSEPRIFYGVENLLEIYSNNELPSPDWLVEFNELISYEQIEPKLLEGSTKPRMEKPNSHGQSIERTTSHFGAPRTNYFKQEFNKDKYFKIPISEPPKSTEIWEAKTCEDYIYDGRRPIPKKKNSLVIKNPESEILIPKPEIPSLEPDTPNPESEVPHRELEILVAEPEILNSEPGQPKLFIEEIKNQEIDSIELKAPRKERIVITPRANLKIDALNDTSPPPIQDTFFTKATHKDLPDFPEPDTFCDQKEEKLEEAHVSMVVKAALGVYGNGTTKEQPVSSNRALSTKPKPSINSPRYINPKSSSNTPKYTSVYNRPVSISIPVKAVTEKPNNKFRPTLNKNLELKNRYSQPPINKKHVDFNHASSSIINYTQPHIEVTDVKAVASTTDAGACFWKNTVPEVATDFNEIIKIQQIEQNEEKKELIQKLKEIPKITSQPKPKNLPVWNSMKSPEVSSFKDIMKEEQRNNDLKKIKDTKISAISKKKTRATNSSQVPVKEPLVKKKSSNDQLFWNSAVDKSNKK